ncbi:hypothetical protein DFJ73DRAFT_822843 [Zopfochytrium polystomum]|nr:hypothetical protein DFJ73DRAFT_822843 [Zopfochytrium polystomum]
MVDTAQQAPRTVYVGDARSGAIWPSSSEWRKIYSGRATVGSLLKVFNATPTSSVRSSLSTFVAPGGFPVLRPVAFTCIASSFEMPDFGGELPPPGQPSGSTPAATSAQQGPSSFAFVLAAADQRGHVVAFDFLKNKFWLVARTGVSATCMSFSSSRRRELVIGLSDASLHCYNLDSGHLAARLPAYHRSEPSHISVHPRGEPLAISTSRTESILWNTEKWERKRVMLGAGPPGVQQASFSPTGESVITAFNDGTILFWDSQTFHVRWKISIDIFAADLEDHPPSQEASRAFAVPRTRHFAVSVDGEYMVYAGLVASIYVWSLVEKRLIHEILIPQFGSRLVSQVEFVGNTTYVAAISTAGEIVFVEAVEARFAGHLSGKHTFRSFSLSPDGRVMSLLLMDAKYSLRVIRLDQILKLSARNQPEEEKVEELSKGDHEVEHQEDSKPPPSKKIQLEMVRAPSFVDLVESKRDSSILSRRKLTRFLRHYGAYPDDFRQLIWRFLLRLPENRGPYETLLEKGPHACVKDFRKKFPIKSDRLLKSMERVLSAVAHWSPIFESLDYLPAIVFPFVKTFANDMFAGFEVILTVLINWCQKWWDYFPNPPFECLNILEDLLAYHDSELHAHFVKLKVTSQIYGWTMLQTLFTELFSKGDWVKLWDHFVTNPPAFMYYFMAAYIQASRTALLHTNKATDVEFFFSRPSLVSLDTVLLASYRLHSLTPDTISPATLLKPFTPLLRGQYPIFNAYPHFVVDYQSKMREKVRKDEEALMRRRKMTNEINRLADRLEDDRRAWEEADWKMNEMVESWWENLMNSEETHEERRARLDAMEKDQRIRALERIADARKSFLSQHQSTTQAHTAALARAVGSNRRAHETHRDAYDLDSRFLAMEREWLARREELLEARTEMEHRDWERAERLVRGAGDIGVPATERRAPGEPAARGRRPADRDGGSGGAVQSGGGEHVDRSIRLPSATEALRRAMDRSRERSGDDGFVGMTQLPEAGEELSSPRAWSPELLEESRYRRRDEVDSENTAWAGYDDGRWKGKGKDVSPLGG